MTDVTMSVNGTSASADIEPRTLLSQFLREHLRLTGTHVGCEIRAGIDAEHARRFPRGRRVDLLDGRVRVR